MKTNSNQSITPTVGQCYRLNFARAGRVMNHLVQVLAASGEWCTILDLQAHGQPNPAGGESLRWTNPHFHFEPLPVSEWPSAARSCSLAPTRRAAAAACRLVRRAPGAARRQTRRRSALVSPAAEVLVVVA